MDSYKILISQIISATRASLLVRYRNSLFGVLWVILNPILLFGAQSIAFNSILNLQIPRFYIFLLSGLLPWIFTVQTIDMTMSTFIQTGKVSKAYQVNPLVFLFSTILDNFLNFILALVFMLSFISIFDPAILKNFYFLPLPLFSLFLGVSGLCLISATYNTFHRDLRFILSFFLQVAFFITPIFFPESFLPDNLRWLSTFNPLYWLIKPVRDLFLLESFGEFFINYLKSQFFSLVLFAFAIFVWIKKKNQVSFHV